MPDPHATAEEYCIDLVRRRDEDRWLSAQYVDEERRPRLIALYALHQEIRQIPTAVSEPPLGEIRLQWWREALDEIVSGGPVRAHPVVEFAAAMGAVTTENCSLIEEAIDARAHLLYGEPFASVKALFEWLDVSEGYLAAVCPSDIERLADRDRQVLIRAESAFALSGEGRGFSSNLLDEALAEVPAAIRAAKSILDMLSAEESAVHLHLTLTQRRARQRENAFTPISKRLRLFKTMATGRF